MSKVGWSRKLPLGEYSIRITSGVSTSNLASPSTTVAWDAALPFAMLTEVDRLTGEVSEVAVWAAAGPTGASRAAAVSAAIRVPTRVNPRRFHGRVNNAVNTAASSARRASSILWKSICGRSVGSSPDQ